MTDEAKPKKKYPKGNRDMAQSSAHAKRKAVEMLLGPKSKQPRLVRFDGDPWDQQIGETGNMYAAFVRYREMGAGKRTVSAIVVELGSLSARTWSHQWLWQQRAAAWDRYLDKERQLAEVEAAREMTKRHIQESLLLQNIGVKDLQKLARKIEAKPDDMVLEAKEALEFVERGAKMERLNRGEPDAITEQRHELTVGDRRAKLRSALDSNEAHLVIERMADLFLADDPEQVVVDADEPLEDVPPEE